jgi:hypothetical protein
MDSKSTSYESLVRRLDILISLVLEHSPAQTGFSMSEKIGKLADLGVAAADIARILGKPLNYVTATLSQRKSRKKEVKKNG